MKFTLSIFGGFVLALAILAGVSYGIAQTQADASRQLKNLNLVVPIASVQRWECSATGTTGGTSWDCNGMQMIKLTLTNGTVLGPYVNIPASAPEVASGDWVTIPLAAPDPPLTLKR